MRNRSRLSPLPSSLCHRPNLQSPPAPRRTPCLKPLSAAVSAILAATAAPTVMAQAQQPDQQSDIEVIMVTAMRREQSIQDIPLNIASFDGNMLNEREIGDLAELGRNVPGIYVVDQGKRTSNQIVVRGLNLDNITSAEGIGNNGGNTVSTYLGDIPLYVDLALNDMQRVEVLLGPQGTLYGAGTLGGAIRYIPQRPELGSTTMDFRAKGFGVAEGGFGNERGLTANVPFGEKLAFRGSVDYYDDPGFIDTPYLVRDPGLSDPEPDFNDPAAVAANLYGQKNANWERTLSGRAALRYQPTDNIDANLTYYYQNMDVGGRTQNHMVAFGTGKYESATRYPEPNNRKNQLLALEITADLGFAELTSATGASQYDELGQRDQTDLLITLEYYYEFYPYFSAFTRENQTDKNFSQEVRLVSKGDSRWNWIAGLFYNKQKSDGTSREFTPHYDEYLGGTLRPDSLEYISQLISDLKERAVFGEVGLQVTNRWQISLGGRYYDYTYKTLSGATTPLYLTAIDAIGPTDIPLDLQANSQDDSGFLGKFNTSFQFTDTVMGFVTVSEGYRIGASNGVAPCPDPLPQNQIVCALPDEEQYFPDKTTNYEIGMHSQWLDHKLTVNTSLFYIDWKDPQLASATANGAQPIIKNGKGATTKGFEISIDSHVTSRLDLGFSFAYTDAKLSADAPNLLRQFTPDPTTSPPSLFGPGGLYDGLDAVYIPGLKGDRLPGSPKTQGTFNFGYYFPLKGKWSLNFDYGLTSIGNILTKPGARAGGEKLPGYTVHFAAATLENGPWTIGVYGQNLTNEYAVTGVRSIRGFVQTVADENGDPVRVRSYANEVLRPREVGLKFSYALKL